MLIKGPFLMILLRTISHHTSKRMLLALMELTSKPPKLSSQLQSQKLSKMINPRFTKNIIKSKFNKNSKRLKILNPSKLKQKT
jgi:hypothetical protein